MDANSGKRQRQQPQQQQHVVLFPYMAHGHFAPFLSLANLIHRRRPELAVTLVSTPGNVRALRSALPPDSTLRLHALPFAPADHGLPAGAENTDSLPPHLLHRFMQASASLRPQFQDFVSSLSTVHPGRRSLVCVVADMFFGWSVEVARSSRAVHATLSTCGAYGWACLSSIYLHLPHTKTDAQEFHVPGFPESFRLHRSQMSSSLRTINADEAWLCFLRQQLSLLRGSDIVLCNTIEELEQFGLRLLRGMSGPPAWAIGPLLPLDSGSSHRATAKKQTISPETCVQWLDMHPPCSVIYVAFGSENTISASQMMALASGLEASGAPFIWVLRPPLGSDANDDDDDGDIRDQWLPCGFRARIAEGKLPGLLVRNWAPQLEILSHRSLGAFVSHCGWNSVLESLSRGVPLVGWPLFAEQFFNSKMLEEELGAGVEMARGATDDVKSDRVEEVIKLVISSAKGKMMKERAVALSHTIKGAMREDGHAKGSSLRAIDGFIQTISGDVTESSHKFYI